LDKRGKRSGDVQAKLKIGPGGGRAVFTPCLLRDAESVDAAGIVNLEPTMYEVWEVWEHDGCIEPISLIDSCMEKK
jgi:hypothetical protein